MADTLPGADVPGTKAPGVEVPGTPRHDADPPGTPTPAPQSPPDIPDAEAAMLRAAGAGWRTVVPAEANGAVAGIDPDLEAVEARGGRPGARYVRVVRSRHQGFEHISHGWLQATPRASAPRTRWARAGRAVRSTVLGPPMATRQFVHERLTKIKALAVLSSDPLSSVAYATEQTNLVLVGAGAVALGWSLPIMLVIAVLLTTVVASYRQTIKAYPKGGGSYIVAKDNLGDLAGLIAAAALMTDYVLTVAVSVASGKDFIGAAFPWVANNPVVVCVVIIIVILLGNLRGIRESASLFAAPTYIFVASILAMLGVAFFRIATHSVLPVKTASIGPATESLTIFLVLKAFASGCTALTGVEAISDGVPAFKPPEWRNARKTLMVMGTLSIAMYIGITMATHIIGLHPYATANPPIVVQLAMAAFGSDTFGVYLVAGATAAILVLAANTAFSDFPRLLFFLSRDGYAPRQFGHLGDRLAYSNGIIVLGTLAIVLVVVFGGQVNALIPLYTIGVFLAFTMSQSGMVTRWLRRREAGWRRGLAMNGMGAVFTGIVFLIVAYSKAAEGAWVVMLLIPFLVVMFRSVKHHYTEASSTLAAEIPTTPENLHPVCVVPIIDLNVIALQSLAMARTISPTVIAVHVCDDDEHIATLRAKWALWGEHVPLTILESPYRAFVRPLLSYIDALDRQRSDITLVVVLPELVATRWWHHLLHNQTALRLKASLLFRPGTVVVSVPHHIRRHRRVPRHRRAIEETEAL